MLDPFDPWVYEVCFPGAVVGEAEVTCPQCRVILTVAVNDPMAIQAYRCSQCETAFSVNWGD
jgi:transposase-like protein